VPPDGRADDHELKDLAKRAWVGVLQFQAILALLLFVPAWSLHFWEAWVYWMLFSGCVLFITAYFLKHDPRLVERRLQVGPVAEPETTQKIIQAIAGVLFCALLIVPGFDHRLYGSALPVPIVVSADVLVVIGLGIVFVVFKENSYTASVVKVEVEQPVISTGPYRILRHPMYAGGMLALLATPLALGSLWALLVAVPLCGAIVVRLLDEERYLSVHLSGYTAYCEKVRYRLIPGIW
jgi:protein-S-isoprenylcysteine O-methyltransferase Ste14